MDSKTKQALEDQCEDARRGESRESDAEFYLGLDESVREEISQAWLRFDLALPHCVSMNERRQLYTNLNKLSRLLDPDSSKISPGPDRLLDEELEQISKEIDECLDVIYGEDSSEDELKWNKNRLEALNRRMGQMMWQSYSNYRKMHVEGENFARNLEERILDWSMRPRDKALALDDIDNLAIGLGRLTLAEREELYDVTHGITTIQLAYGKTTQWTHELIEITRKLQELWTIHEEEKADAKQLGQFFRALAEPSE